MNNFRLSDLFTSNKAKSRKVQEINIEEPAAKMLIAFVQTMSKEYQLNLEDIIAGLIVILMQVEDLDWEDFWLVVSKIASKVPFIFEDMDVEPSSDPSN